MGILEDLAATANTAINGFDKMTVGRVVSANDPQQMGRLRVLCSALGDAETDLMETIPWATYVSPLGGMVQAGSRGREDDISTGPVAYGMWNIPKVGATVLIACIDGDPNYRIWLGCVNKHLLTHTMPHGRYSYRDDIVTQSGFDWEGEEGKPLGPFSSQEEKIQPNFDQLELAFTPTTDTTGTGAPADAPRKNFEYRTRGADHSVSTLSEDFLFSDGGKTSYMSDDSEFVLAQGKKISFTEPDGEKLFPSQGYNKSRTQPNLTDERTTDTLDSQIYSWTTPGFHAMAMDDSAGNCRMRFRTTHGHQIILDDTNERIYISTSGGKSWVELDEAGNIDFYASRNISFHAEKDFNITADNIRMKADTGIHMISEGEMRIHTKADDLHIKSDQNIRMHSMLETRIQSIGSLHLTSETVSLTANTQMDIKVSGGTLYIEASADVDTKAGGSAIVQAEADVSNVAGGEFIADAAANNNILAGGNVLITGSQVHANGPPASPGDDASGATAAEVTEHKESWWTNRIPEHEPWPRVMTKESITDLDVNNTHAASAEFTYDEADVGRTERGFDMTRNKNWHR